MHPPSCPCRLLLAIALALGSPAFLFAQLPAVPVVSAPLHDYRYALRADAALSHGDIGREWALGARAAIERDSFHIEAMVASVHARDDQHDAGTAVGLQIARVITHRFSPTFDVDLETGVGYAKFTLPQDGRYSEVTVPLGVGFSFRGPHPVFGTPEAWIAPRAQLRRSSLTEGGIKTTRTRVGGGFGVGINWVFLSGVEAQVAAEWIWIKSAMTGRTRAEPGFRLSGGYRWGQ
jgi:hypothetical protein